MRRAAVISNCQARPITDYLRLRLPDFEFDVLGVHLLDPKNTCVGATEFVERINSSCEIVFCLQLSDQFGPISSSEIANALSDSAIIHIPNIFFSGLHPDLTYLGGLGQRLQGPLGDYHSKITTIGFILGKSVEDTRRMFCGNTFEKLLYFSEFERSLNELRGREAGLTFGASSIIEGFVAEKPCFLTVNHPTSFLLTKYLDGLVQNMLSNHIISRSMPPLDYHLLPNPFSTSTIFPVYPEIAEFHSLKYSGSYIFKGPQRNGRELLFDLKGFIESEYAALQSVSKSRLAAHPSIQSSLALWMNS